MKSRFDLAMHELLRSYGFVKHGKSHYRVFPEIIQVATTGIAVRFRLRWIEIGWFLAQSPFEYPTANEPVSADRPQFHLCHVRVRAEVLAAEAYQRVESLFHDYSDSKGLDSRDYSPAVQFLRAEVLEVLDASKDLAGLSRVFVATSSLRNNAIIHPEVRAILSNGHEVP